MLPQITDGAEKNAGQGCFMTHARRHPLYSALFPHFPRFRSFIQRADVQWSADVVDGCIHFLYVNGWTV